MQAHVDEKKRLEDEDLESTEPSNDEHSLGFSF